MKFDRLGFRPAARGAVGTVAAAFLWGLGCMAHEGTDPPPPQVPQVAGPVVVAPAAVVRPPEAPPYQFGRASYYSDRFRGRRTANGERYDPGALTAAHPTLPFGTVVHVVRRDGRAVEVRINDRGPFVHGRIIDLSRRAAELLGLIRDGVAEVSLRVVWLPEPRTSRR